MIELARDAGLLTFQAPRRFGGREPSHREQAVLFEAAGWSTLGPVALNCAAPDEGNMYLLGKIADYVINGRKWLITGCQRGPDVDHHGLCRA